MEDIERVKVLGISVDILSMEEALECINRLIVRANTSQNLIVAINPGKAIRARNDAGLMRIIENSSLLIADGIGIVLGVRWLHGKRISRVTGIDLMLTICREANEKGYKLFFYGATETVNKKAVENLRILYPGICIVGRSNGYIKEDRIPELIDKMNNSCADILFVALSSPKQEKWIDKHLFQLNVKICQGIGGSLDIVSGQKKRAPLFIQKWGLEWFYRFFDNPKLHLGRKILDAKFFLLLILATLRQRFTSSKKIKS